MAKWLPTLTILLSGALTAASPAIRGLIGAHPVASSIATTIAGLVLHLTTAPKDQ